MKPEKPVFQLECSQFISEQKKHWSPNKDGFCLAPEFDLNLSCKALKEKRSRIQSLWLSKAADNPRLHHLIISVF